MRKLHPHSRSNVSKTYFGTRPHFILPNANCEIDTATNWVGVRRFDVAARKLRLRRTHSLSAVTSLTSLTCAGHRKKYRGALRDSLTTRFRTLLFEAVCPGRQRCVQTAQPCDLDCRADQNQHSFAFTCDVSKNLSSPPVAFVDCCERFVCWYASIAALISNRSPSKALVPLIFLFVILLAAMRFGRAAGILGTMTATLISYSGLWATIQMVHRSSAHIQTDTIPLPEECVTFQVALIGREGPVIGS